MAFGHERQDLELPRGELVELALLARPPDEPGDDRRVEDALAFVDALERVDEHGNI